MDTNTTQRITVQVLNGATGEIREVIARREADTEQAAVDAIMAQARRDDYYYRFLGMRGVIAPTTGFDSTLEHEGQTYFARY